MAVEFPAFLKLEFNDDGSAKSRFIRAVDDTLSSAETRFESFSVEAKRQIDAALSVNRNAFGSLDVGAADARAVAQAAQARATAARELAAATAIAAREETGYSQGARAMVAALEAQAIEEEQAASAALSHAAALEQVQGILNRQTSATDAVIRGTRGLVNANDNAGRSLGTTRMGLQQLSFQLNDVATMWALGARPMQIFASQSGQVIQAVQMMSGGTSKLAGFLGGPWGLALTSAAVVLAPFVGKLFEAADAEAKVEFSSYRLSDAQSVLGTVFDLTTGKIRTQSDALIGLAKAQAIAGQIQAQQDMANARKALTKEAAPRPHITGGFGGGLDINMGRDATGDIASALLDGSLNTQEAIAGLNSLRKSGYATEQQFLDTAKAVTDLGVAGENLKVFQQAEKALGGDKSALAGLLKPDKHKGRKTDAAAQLAEFGEDAAKKIANIRDSFADIPPEVEKSNKATRELDDVISDLERRKPKGFQELVAEAEHLKQIIPTLGLDKALNAINTETEHRAQIDQLILQGRDAEASALQQIWQLEKQFGPLDEAHRQEIEQTARAEQVRIEANQRLLDLQRDYLDATGSVRSEIESILAGEGKIGDFKRIFKELNAKVLTKQIFGPALDDLDKWVKASGNPLQTSVDNLSTQTDRASTAILGLGDAANAAMSRIASATALPGLGGTPSIAAAGLTPDFIATALGLGVSTVSGSSAASAANDNASAQGDEIVVTAKRLANGPMGLTPERYVAMTSNSLAGALTDELNQVFGVKFFSQLQGTLGGAFYGYATGGAPGGILGGLQGLISDFGGKLFGGGQFGNNVAGFLYDKLGQGLQGAQAGSLISGLANSFGLHLSSMGSQIGGAIGGALPIPGGDIIGAIAGGIIGKLFGGTKSGRVTISSSGSYTGGTSSKLAGQVAGIGDDFISTLHGVADQLGGTLGSFGQITVGQRNGNWRVNVGGGGTGALKLSHGARDFGDDQQAAIAYALQQAIVNGAVKGISAGAKRLLQSGKDLQAQLQKALDFQSVFTELKQYTDPVGAALDTLNAKFEHLKDVFEEAGASSADYAKLEKLYGIERSKAVADAIEQVSGSLKSLLDDLTTGDMGLSLRDRQSAAQGKYDALAARVKAGDTTAYADYADAARTLLDIDRQIYGSQSQYFDLFNEVKNLTKATLDAQQKIADAAQNGDSPFSNSASSAASDNQGVIDGLSSLGDRLVNELGDKIANRLDAVNQNLGALIANGAPRAPAQMPLLSQYAGQW
jgi:hypothetical protein